MKRSDLLYVMSLGRSGAPDAAVMRNSRALRRALANRGHSAACASASGGECDCSCGGSMHGSGQSGDNGLLDSTRVSALNLAPNGRTYVGFTDSSAEPPRNHYLPVGGTEDGWKVVSASYDSEEVVLEKGGKRISLSLGRGGGAQKTDGGDQRPEARGQTESEDSFPLTDIFNEGYEDFEENGISGMDPGRADALAKALGGAEALDSLEGRDRTFMEQYIAMKNGEGPDLGGAAADRDPGVRRRAAEILDGRDPGAEPPDYADLTAWVEESLSQAQTPQDRAAVLAEYRASLEATRRIWEKAAAEAFKAANGYVPRNYAERRMAEGLAGVPKMFRAANAGISADGVDRSMFAQENRAREDRKAALRNRVGAALANIGWTDEARAAALAVRRMKSALREKVRKPPVPPRVPGGGGGTAGRTGISAAPASEGMVVPSKDGFAVMRNGVPVRLGSSKALVMLPDGRVAVKRNGRAYPVDDPMTLIGGRSTVEESEGKRIISLAVGDMIDLETGEPKKLPDQLNATLVSLTPGPPVAVRMPFLGAGVPIPGETGVTVDTDSGIQY